MLETILLHLHNWFIAPGGVHAGAFRITDGALDIDLRPGQYYRIMGSVFNDGLHKFGVDILTNEDFDGEVWALAVPRAVIDLSAEIAEWRENNPESAVMSESFGGYSYTKAGTSTGAPAGWQSVFKARLNAWRKLP